MKELMEHYIYHFKEALLTELVRFILLMELLFYICKIYIKGLLMRVLTKEKPC